MVWWYSAGLVEAKDWLIGQINNVIDFFSLEVLVKTWIAPWKGDVEDANNISLQDRAKLWEDNLASRLIGFVIRSVVIIIALLAVGFIGVLGIFFLIIWLLMPFLVVVLPFVGVALS